MPAASSFRFLVINDPHHAEAACTPFFEQLVAHMRTQAPFDFCLLLGDLADTGRVESLVAVRDIFAKLEVPVYTVPGNHDCDVEQNTRLYAEIFPDRLNYHFVHRGWQFIGLDTTDGNAWHDTRIGDATLGFLDATLPKLSRDAPMVVFTHFPLGTSAARLTPLNASDVLTRVGGHNLRATLGGHYHARTLSMFGQTAFVTNACCSRVRQNHDGTLPEGYLVCTAHADGRLEREFVEFAPARKAQAHAPLFQQLGWG